MSRGRKRKRSASSAAPPATTGPPAKSSPAKKLVNVALLGVLALIIAVTVAISFQSGPTSSPVPAPVTDSSAQRAANVEPLDLPEYHVEPETLDELLSLPSDQLAEVDIARVNLLTATGLPGAENLDIDHALTTLDEWAERVHFETERHLYRVDDPRYAAHYRHSEAYFRAEMLLQVLQQDLNVQYDMTAADNFDFADSRVAFIHGMIPAPAQTIGETSGGTCASMPVMYVAVGRRLGYPLNLVTTDGHVFVRWDGENHENPAWRERFNIEGAGEGFESFEDDYYTTWPFEVTDHEVRVNGYLLSLNPMEEFASFLAARGHGGEDNGQFAFAARAYENAYRYDSSRPAHRSWFMDAALRGNYQPVTPPLASALRKREHRMASAARDPATQLGIPASSATAMYEEPGTAGAARVGPWREQASRSTADAQRWQLPQPTQRPQNRPTQPDHSITPPEPQHPQANPSPDWGTP